MGTTSLSIIKRPGRGDNHPPSSGGKVKKSKDIPLLPLWAFMAGYMVNFTVVIPYFMRIRQKV
jgi:hypothetical protein